MNISQELILLDQYVFYSIPIRPWRLSLRSLMTLIVFIIFFIITNVLISLETLLCFKHSAWSRTLNLPVLLGILHNDTNWIMIQLIFLTVLTFTNLTLAILSSLLSQLFLLLWFPSDLHFDLIHPIFQDSLPKMFMHKEMIVNMLSLLVKPIHIELNNWNLTCLTKEE